MQTQDLISRLATDLAPVSPNAVSRALNRALVLGLAGNTAVLAGVYGIGSDMPEQMLTAGFWIKLAFPLGTIAAALTLADRLARPGYPSRRAWLKALAPVAAMLAVTVALKMATPAELRLRLPLGETGIGGLAGIVLLSLPALAAAMHAMKRLAPTRLALTGAGIGLLAGAQGVFVYTLFRPASPWFMVDAWHVCAIPAVMAIGAILAPRILRW